MSYEQACVNNSSFTVFWELLNSEDADVDASNAMNTNINPQERGE